MPQEGEDERVTVTRPQVSRQEEPRWRVSALCYRTANNEGAGRPLLGFQKTLARTNDIRLGYGRNPINLPLRSGQHIYTPLLPRPQMLHSHRNP